MMENRESENSSGRWKKTGLIMTIILIVTAGSLLPGLDTAGIRELLQQTTVRVDTLDPSGEVYSFGSGFMVSENGMLLTNFHVIEDSLREGYPLRVVFQDGRAFKTEILQWNYRRDWAVLHIQGESAFPYLEFAASAEILDDIWAAGYPVTGNFKITAGMINSYQPDFMDSGVDYYDVSMNFDGGNSGGPVINEHGEVVGIVVAYYTEARAFDFIIPMADVADEIYWMRYLSGSSAIVPGYISGIGEDLWEYGTMLFTNSTGYDIWYLHLLTEEMMQEGVFGADVLGDLILYDAASFELDPTQLDWIYEPVFVEWGERIHVIAEDVDGDYYHMEWYPDFDEWRIDIPFSAILD